MPPPPTPSSPIHKKQGLTAHGVSQCRRVTACGM
jgi:hypothetical protein